MDQASVSYGQTLDALKAMQAAKKPAGDIVQEGTDMYYRLCQDMLNELSKTNGDEYFTPAELELLRLERDTWSLVRALYIDKNEPLPTSTTPQALLQRNPYTPAIAIVQRVMDHEPTLRRLSTVVNWLHDTAPAPSTSTHQSGYRRRTQREIVGARQAGQARAGLPKALDPDALNRESGVSLYPDDTAAEASLSYDLFRLVRAGRLKEALTVAADAGHPWLAAVLHGSLPFQWTAVTSRDTVTDTENEANRGTSGWQGNKRRKLWREACLQAAASPTYSPATRALYASLCLTSRSIPAVTPLLRTWEDHLWARVEMLLTERIAGWLDHLGGFWENGMKASDPQSSAKLQDLPDENQWWADVDKLVREMGNVRVEDGAASDNAFHFAQLHLVLGNVNGLLEQVASTCASRAEQEQPSSRDWQLVIRFFAHLCLFLRVIHEPIPTPAVDVILNEYIRQLETDPTSSPLVALYVGALGESAVEKYASYLARLDVHLPQKDRESALRDCEKHGLDVGQVAVMAAALAARAILAVLPNAKGPLPDPTSGPPQITENEHVLVRSLDWLLYTGRTGDEALAQANSLIRYFLGIGRPVGARVIMSLVSQKLIRTRPDSDFHSGEGIEFQQYQQYVSLTDALDNVPSPDTYPSGESAQKRAAWKDAYLRAIDNAWRLGLDLLTHSWLENDLFKMFSDSRLEELRRVRSIHVPDAVIRLSYILLNSRAHSEGNLDRAMELVPIVADERYFVYPTFIAYGGNRLEEYLDGVRHVGLALLEAGRNPNDLFIPSQKR
ncbi:hypothetical protein M407DRAFT_26387 [Tulasnella calospora MUT 4182]|uniref:Nuclear pore complex protein n=1 Tax=Tulasnella calospora MUT 4182 TaxID=1051891 RepID=A0A0C3LS00_9AGAM|nr:hypothetical protein M407DRAFT_26387 [Tulasnella calospora MUT 4182]